jgi:O-antigen/teichoic acid export membrane protein
MRSTIQLPIEREGARPRQARSISKNILYVALARGSAIALDGVSYLLVARYLGPSEYGFYLSVVAAITLIDVASDLSVFDVAVRETANQPERSGAWLGASSFLRTALGCAGLIAFLAYAFFGPPAAHPQIRQAAMLGALALPIGSLRMPLSLFRAELRMEYEFILLALTRLTNLLILVAFMAAHSGLLALIAAMVLSRTFLAVSAWTVCLRVFRVRPQLHWADLRVLMVECLPMAISGVFVALQLKLDLLMVTAISGAARGGIYGVVAQLPEYLLYVPVIVTTPLLPVLSRAFKEGRQSQYEQLFDKLVQGIILVSVPTVLISFFRARDLVVLMFGNKFAGASAYFPWIMLSVGFMWISHALAVATVASSLQRHFVWIQLVCVVLFLAICFLMIPEWGGAAAVLARVVGTFLAAALTLVMLRMQTKLTIHVARLTPALMGAVAATIVLVLTRASSMYVSILGALLIYGAIAWFAYSFEAVSEVTA